MLIGPLRLGWWQPYIYSSLTSLKVKVRNIKKHDYELIRHPDDFLSINLIQTFSWTQTWAGIWTLIDSCFFSSYSQRCIIFQVKRSVNLNIFMCFCFLFVYFSHLISPTGRHRDLHPFSRWGKRQPRSFMLFCCVNKALTECPPCWHKHWLWLKVNLFYFIFTRLSFFYRCFLSWCFQDSSLKTCSNGYTKSKPSTSAPHTDNTHTHTPTLLTTFYGSPKRTCPRMFTDF